MLGQPRPGESDVQGRNAKEAKRPQISKSNRIMLSNKIRATCRLEFGPSQGCLCKLFKGKTMRIESP